MIYLVSKNPTLYKSTDGFDCMTWEDAIKTLTGVDYLFLDIETTGFNFLSDNILSIQVAKDSADQWIFLTKENQKDIASLFDMFNSASIMVGHNLKFDLKFLRSHGFHIKIPIYDTMLCEQILINGTYLKAGLDAVVQRYCQVLLDKSIRKQFIMGHTLTPAQIRYAADDVKYLKPIMVSQIKELEKRDSMPLAKLECATALAFVEIEHNGLSIDVNRWRKMIEILRIASLETRDAMNTIIDSDDHFKVMRQATFQTDMFLSQEESMRTNIDWNSVTTILKVFQCIDNSIIGTTEADCIRIGKKNPIGLHLQKYRTQSKKVNSFGDSFLANIFQEDGKIHPNFMQIKRTGRVSCRDPNMQQIPGDNAWRNCFTTEPGHVFVSADYSSQELCIIAYGSQDPVFNYALTHGHDLHSVCAALVFADKWKTAGLDSCSFIADFTKCSCPEHKKLRTAVKSINFGLAYGMGPKKLSETMEISMAAASTLIENYFKAFPKIKAFLESMSKYGIKKGYIQTFAPWKRTRWFPDWAPYRLDMGIKSRIERVSKNTPIQGTAADMTKHALVLCDEYIKKNKIPVKLVLTVHDQIDTTCPKEYAEEWAAILKSLMEKAAEHIMNNDLLKAEVQITEKWSK